MTTPLPTDPDERLALLAEELEGCPRARDVAELAERFDLPRELVEGTVVAARAFDEAFGEDLPEDLAPPIPLPPGYDLVSELGRGGMGVVYRVHHRALGRDVALKALRLTGPDAPTAARFEREVRALARLRHPHIVRVFEGGDVDGAMYYTMEFIAGSTLAELIPNGIGIARSVRLLMRIADAVEHAHQHGIVHRDLKPSNILIDEAGEPFVVDFGLARDAGLTSGTQKNTPTLTGQVVGTPAYMSPEQAAGVPAGEAADIYALGTILYECLTTKRPFTDSPVPELLWRVMHEEPERPGSIVPAIPRALETICQHAMRKDPSRRYPSAQAFRADLERFTDGRPIQAQPPSALERSRLWLQRRASHLLTAALAILVASLVTHAIFAGPTADETAAERMSAGDEFASRGDHGAARLAYREAMLASSSQIDECIAAEAWIEESASRLAELLRLQLPDRAQLLLDECRDEEPRLRRLLTGHDRSSWRAATCFHWQRLEALADLTPTLTFESDLLEWRDIERRSRPGHGEHLLVKSLESTPGPERDASLALLLTADSVHRRPVEEWTSRPLALIEHWLIDALRRFDPDCPLAQHAIDLATVEGYASTARPPFARAASTLAGLLRSIEATGERREYVAAWSPLRAHLALITRHNLGGLTVLWEESREFAGPMDWRIERRDNLAGPLPATNLPTRTRFDLDLGALDVESKGWSGRVIHVHLATAELDVGFGNRTNLAGTDPVDVFLTPGTTVSLGTMSLPWLLTDPHCTNAWVMLTVEDGDNAPTPGGLAGWRERVRRSLRRAREPGERPVADSELWTRLDPVFDLAVTDARGDAIWLLAHAPEHAPVETNQRWYEFARVALGANELPAGQFRARRGKHNPTLDCAWIAMTCDDPAIRTAMLNLIKHPSHAKKLPIAARWDLKAAWTRERWTLPAAIATVVNDAADPGDSWLGPMARRLLEGPWRTALVFGLLAIVLAAEVRRWRQHPTTERSNQAAVFVIISGNFLWFLSLGREPLPAPPWLGPLTALLGSVWWRVALPSNAPPQARRARRNVALCFATGIVVSLIGGKAWIFTLIPMLLGIGWMYAHTRTRPQRRFEAARKRLARRQPRAS